MSRRALAALLLLTGCARTVEQTALASAAPPTAAEPTQSVAVPAGNPAVGGIVPPTDGTLAQDVAALPTLAVLERALVAAGAADNLGRPGPVTLFAPTDEAFGRLAPGTVDALLKPENRAALTKLLNLHLVPGALTGLELMRRITAGGGRATLTSVAGEPLTATMTGGIVTLTDSGGNRSYVEVADVRAANGVLHVVNGVLVPRLN